MQTGMIFASIAYVIWGLFPVYFKALQHIPPLEILIHRIIWSLIFILMVLVWRRQWGWLGKTLKQPKVLGTFALSALLLSSNWFVYVWAVGNGRIVDASLGYFINPLVNVLLGFLLLHERLRSLQWTCIAIAASGVAWLTWQSGHLPWVALILASTFGTYGLLRKIASLGALEGFSLETILLFPIAISSLLVLTIQNQNTFLVTSATSQWMLIATGPITAIPLLLFAAGARRIPLSVLGLLQYIGPTLQLLLGIWLYHEPFGIERQIGFGLIWGALALYSFEGLWQAYAAKSPS